MARKQSDDSFSEKEAAARLGAALRGARITGHKTMEQVVAEKRKERRKQARARILKPNH